jgi:hypothetical protein
LKPAQRTTTRGALLIGALALLLGDVAVANDADRTTAVETRTAREILSRAERADAKRRWIPDHVQLDEHAGLAYRRSLSLGTRRIDWAVQGPLVADEAYGLGFELRF